MIYLIGSKNDITMERVCEWLLYFGENFLFVDSIESTIQTHIDWITKKRDREQVKIWIWKLRAISLEADSNGLTFHVNEELQKYVNTIIHNVKRENRLGNVIERIEIDKIYQLKIAEKIGFNIPKTKMISSKVELNKYQSLFGELITKPLSNGLIINTKNKLGRIHTKKVNNVIEVPNTFQPSLIQEKLKIQFELRVIFVEKELSAVAIFKDNSKDDVKEYDVSELRCVPYLLDDDITNKIHSLIDYFDLNFGSIDLVYTRNVGYIFLEVNPVGQFDYYSNVCNYDIHKKIAKWLSIRNQ